MKAASRNLDKILAIGSAGNLAEKVISPGIKGAGLGRSNCRRQEKKERGKNEGAHVNSVVA